MSSENIVTYPIRGKEKSKWQDPEFRKMWNRQYRAQIKEGERQPTRRSDEPSKWEDKDFRNAYDKARQEKLAQDRKQKKMSFEESEKRPNYTQDEKDEILQKLLDMVREGKNPVHPYFQLSLAVKDDLKRSYSRSKKN